MFPYYILAWKPTYMTYIMIFIAIVVIYTSIYSCGQYLYLLLRVLLT